eukprot:TRINITY_DN62750_c0_g1_i1.p1 TRINITY_DN62750_c0_g1~~TRINITY_DN62750_c0_g1_i1.p1  ORF type:complete len:272 (+),score=14.59 TRINITY_DN62750_c0_g1_i1:48-863(+)
MSLDAMVRNCRLAIHRRLPKVYFPLAQDGLTECLVDAYEAWDCFVYGEDRPGREEREAKATVVRHVHNSVPLALSLILGTSCSYFSLAHCIHHWPSLLQISFHRAHRLTCWIMGAWGAAELAGLVHIQTIMIRCSGSLSHWSCRRMALCCSMIFGSMTFMPIVLHYSIWHVGVSIPLVINNLLFCFGASSLNYEVAQVRYLLIKSWSHRYLPRTHAQYILDQMGQGVDRISVGLTGQRVAGHAIVSSVAAKSLEVFSYAWLVWTPFMAQKF